MTPQEQLVMLGRSEEFFPYDCTYLFFKPSGKWKYEGRGRFPRPQHDGWHEIDRAEIMRENGGMPGIMGDGADYIIVVIPDDDCDVRSAYPRMLRPVGD